jgi:hypothetical protein
MNSIINSSLRLLKWPIAISAVLALPGLLLASVDLGREIADHRENVDPFLIGLTAYLVAWFVFLRERSLRDSSFWSTLEHELTHILFTLISFGKVRGLNATDRQGGYIHHLGGGNWLIAISPYFFPTLSLPVILLMPALDGDAQQIATGILGVTAAYHITSTHQEAHRQQTDLHYTGFRFAWCFLPAANFLSYGLILAMASSGMGGMNDYVANCWNESQALFSQGFEHVKDLI